MGFKRAVENTPSIAEAYRPGLQAMEKEHRDHVAPPDTRLLTGSINLDRALATAMPNAPRWDYGVGLKTRTQSEKAIWIEVHPASSNHIDGILAKLGWLKGWLRTDAPRLKAMPAEFVWIASGRVSLPPHSPQRRKIAGQGLRFGGERYTLA